MTVTVIQIGLDPTAIDRMAHELADLRAREGRLFFLGVGGSAVGINRCGRRRETARSAWAR